MRKIVRAINDDIIAAIKAELKAKGIAASIRKNKQAYAVGGITIQPRKSNDYRFTGAEAVEIAKVLKSYSINTQSSDIYENIDNPDRMQLFYSRGFHFINIIEAA